MTDDSTCWTVIRGATAGNDDDRSEFAHVYLPVVRAYLRARWRGSPLVQDVDDAIQEVFVDLFKEGGALERADSQRPGGFQAFLYGVVRNVARQAERRAATRKERNPSVDLAQLEGKEEEFTKVFDRAWATAIVQEAGKRQAARAREKGDGAAERVQLLKLRFVEGLPIREIATRWEKDAAALHHEYAKARREFKECLLEVILFHHPGTREAAVRECNRLLGLLE